MIIGNLTYDETGDTYSGELTTLSVRGREVEFQPSRSTADGTPDYRVVSATEAGDVEFGAAWKKRSEEGRDYLSVKLDDPAMSQPFNCAVVAAKNSTEHFLLVWNRKKPEEAKSKPTHTAKV